jgi:pimeloyl-ACP methyl ester carboxylesterase
MMTSPDKIFPKGKVPAHTIEKLKETRTATIQRICFDSTFPLDFANNNRVTVYHYEPKHCISNRAVIILHGWRSTTLLFEKLLAAALVRRGFHAYLFILPFHFERTPPGRRNGVLYFTLDQQHSSNAYKQTIADLRNLADLLDMQNLHLGIVGSSLGAVVLHTLTGIDSRFTCSVSILGGGNIHRIVWDGLLGRFVVKYLKRQGITTQDYRQVLIDYETYLASIDKTGKIPEPKYHWFTLDPLTYAHLNHPRKTLMINGMLDMIIPKKAVLELHKALGNPELIWLPAFHLTVFLFAPFIIEKSVRFFTKHL